mmetsp:Transcript_1244/g.2692  ORF Transcript_1244/g.2692 Transcript_1244/m.2692 type:complete len:234 (+) Transcript_1244:3358-4059(+)
MAISKSRPVNSHRWRWVYESSALNTGPISNTRSKSAQMAICLYSWGDCARQAGRPLYSRWNTAAPPSDAPAISLGVWISWNPMPSSVSRNSCPTPLWHLKMAWLAGVRRSRVRLSSRVSWLTVASTSPFSSAALISASERVASTSSKGSTRALLTTRMLLTLISTSDWEHDSTGFSGTETTPPISTMDSLGIWEAYLTMPLLTVVSSANRTTCAVAVRCLRTRNADLPLPLTV